LAALADISLAVAADGVSVPVRDLDVVAVVSGAGADRAPLLLEAGRASVGVLLVVDPSVDRPTVSAVGGVLVLTASAVEPLISLWDQVVAR
jgi:hypothetical protein